MTVTETTPVGATGLPDELPEIVSEAIAALVEHKGERPVVLGMRDVSAFTDYMVICSGRSERHVKALADAVREHLLERGYKTRHVEGLNEGKWVLLDYLELVVHVFTEQARDFYQLERLWRDAPMLTIEA